MRNRDCIQNDKDLQFLSPDIISSTLGDDYNDVLDVGRYLQYTKLFFFYYLK